MQTLRHIVAGTDFSRCADHAVATAIKLAAVTAASITVVHVCEPGVDDVDDQHLAQCHEQLSQVVARHQHHSVHVTGVLRSGRPWTKLDNVAVEVGADLIVIGRHGAGCGQGAALGAVAEQLVRSASRPVLTVPSDFDRLNHEADETNINTNTTHRKNTTP